MNIQAMKERISMDLKHLSFMGWAPSENVIRDALFGIMDDNDWERLFESYKKNFPEEFIN